MDDDCHCKNCFYFYKNAQSINLITNVIMSYKRYLLLAFFSSFIVCDSLPAQVDFSWERFSGPYGHVVTRTLWQDSSGAFLLGTICNRLFRSTDEGATWEILGVREDPMAVTVSPKGDSYIVYNDGTIWRSIDHGETWQKLPRPGYSIGAVQHNGISVYSESVIYLAVKKDGQYQILQTIDTGATWNIVDRLGRHDRFRQFYRIGNRVLFFSEDYIQYLDGKDEQLQYAQMPFFLINNIVQGVDGILYAAALDSNLWSSVDSGVSWKKVDIQLPAPPVTFSISHNGTFHLLTTHSDIYTSRDRGKTWYKSLDRKSIGGNQIVNSPSGTTMIQGSTLYRTTDEGTSWSKSSEGIFGTRVISQHVLKNGRILLGTLGYGLLTSNDNGITWTESYDSVRIDSLNRYVDIVDFLDIVETELGVLLAATYYGTCRSDDGGTKWTLIDTLKNNNARIEAGNGIILSRIWMPNGVILRRSTDEGITWEQIEPNIQVFQITYNPRNKSFLGENSGDWFESIDSGKTWNPFLMINERNTGLHLFVDHHTGNLYEVTSVYEQGAQMRVRYTSDNGMHWNDVSKGLDGAHSLSSLVVNKDGGALLCTNDSLTYYLGAKEEKWTQVAMNNTTLIESLIALEDGRILATTFCDGLYVTSVPIVSSVPEVVSAQEDRLFLEIYPNPTTDWIIVQAPPSKSYARYRLSNMLGKTIGDWDETLVPVLNKKASINVSGIPSGLYLFQAWTLAGEAASSLVVLY